MTFIKQQQQKTSLHHLEYVLPGYEERDTEGPRTRVLDPLLGETSVYNKKVKQKYVTPHIEVGEHRIT